MEEEKEQQISLIGKVVKVRDLSSSIDYSGIISFMYPSFIVKDEIFFDYDNSIIYNGKYMKSIREELSHGTKEFIALCDTGIPDIDFTQRETQIEILYSRSKRKVSEAVREIVYSMDDVDFWEYFKRYWVLGRTPIDDEIAPSMFELYKVIGKYKSDIIKTYLKLREYYTDSTIFSSVLSFIEKSQNTDNVSTNNGMYLKMLRDFNDGWGDKVTKLMQYVYTLPSQSESDIQYRTIYLITHLGKGDLVE